MAVQVELIDEAVEDLRKYARSGRLKDFLSKLVRIASEGESAGVPLGKGLGTWRKVTVGDRDWRIVFRVTADVATVLVIGDRSDLECYEEATQRLEKLTSNSGAQTLASVMLDLIREQKANKKRR